LRENSLPKGRGSVELSHAQKLASSMANEKGFAHHPRCSTIEKTHHLVGFFF
jgi:hypothetical protein